MALVVIGIGFRVLRYAQGRDLWLDEVFLANNLLHKSAWGLLGPLDFRQGAPPVFLLLCKLSVTVFGTSEYALRLVPLVFGVASVPLFYLLARRVLGGWGAVAAVGLFAVLEPLVYYASEIKQYSADVAVAIAVMLAFARFEERPGDRRRLAALGVVGGLALFTSHPSVFVLGGGVLWLLARRVRVTRPLVVMLGAWGAAFVADYLLFLRPLAANEGLQHHWAYGYPPYSAALPRWLYETYLEVFRGYSTMWLWFESFDEWPAKVAAAVSVVGWIALWAHTGRGADRPGDGPTLAPDEARAGDERAGGLRRWAGLVTFPVVLTLAAAFVHKYPFDGRLILFLVPMFVLAIGAAVAWRVERGWVGAIMAGVVLAGIGVPAAMRAGEYAVRPPGREEIRPVLGFMKDRWRDGDVLYVYHAADAAYLYYRKQVGLPEVPFVHGHRETEEPGVWAREVERLAGRPRVWVLFCHVWGRPGGGDEEGRIMGLLTERGRVVEESRSTGASVYLLDLSESPAK